jgi:hypothetical protein
VQRFRTDPWWNSIGDLYPGDDYVGWLGLSVYGLPNLPTAAS